jgi:hypothetical protein
MSILPFGKNRGKALERCDESYVKWLATHKKVLNPLNWRYADEAQKLLEKKEEKAMYISKYQIDDVMEDGKSLEIRGLRSFLGCCVNVDPSVQGAASKLRIGQVVELGLTDAEMLKDRVVMQIKIA